MCTCGQGMKSGGCDPASLWFGLALGHANGILWTLVLLGYRLSDLWR